MKKMIIGGLVGGILLFAWQTISWTVSGLHESGQRHTNKQDSILQYLSSIGLEEGGYMLPRSADGVSSEQMQKDWDASMGKPWARLTYYKSMDLNMGMNMARGAISNIIIVCLLIWIFTKMGTQSFSTYLISSLLVGIICFTNGAYTGHIWYPLFDINAYLVDSLVGWGLVGVWLGWWMGRK